MKRTLKEKTNIHKATLVLLDAVHLVMVPAKKYEWPPRTTRRQQPLSRVVTDVNNMLFITPFIP